MLFFKKETEEIFNNIEQALEAIHKETDIEKKNAGIAAIRKSLAAVRKDLSIKTGLEQTRKLKKIIK